MGLLVDGVWTDQWYDTKSSGGTFQRQAAGFRNWVTPDGAPGPSGDGGFAAESGRYHLYVSYACPWAHRTLIFRALKGLEDHISVSVVHPLMKAHGWTLADDYPGATGDPVLGKSLMHQVYTEAVPDATTRVTVPVLWDKQQGTIVSNESAEIIRMLNAAFDGITGNGQDFYPEALRTEIDAVNGPIYDNVNNGVYKSGFATTQDAYDEAVTALFAELDRLEARLSGQRYLVGDRITEADWRLWTTLVRFDAVYVGHFKCNIQRLVDYPALWAYSRELYQWPGVAGTVNMDHIRYHYHASHETINPHGIVPKGPEIDFLEPHGRDAM
ncbi:MAG: glutathione S-transferase family protein [Pseudomonadota bacterium]